MTGNLGDQPFHLPTCDGRELFALGDLEADQWCGARVPARTLGSDRDGKKPDRPRPAL